MKDESPSPCSVEEYFRLERESPAKHEYRGGKIVAMAGGSPNHSLIITNAIRAIGNRLEKSPCRVYESNLRVRLAPSVRYSYPDVTVICGQPEFDPLDQTQITVINPRLIIEVTSKSTEYFDRVEKLGHYLQLQSLQEYVLISQQRPRLEGYYRQSAGSWLFTCADRIESDARLRSLEIDLPLREIYSGVAFPNPDAELSEL